MNGRPLPQPDNVSAPFWAAAAEGKVLFQECPECGHRQFYPRAMCTDCAAETEWREASGRGTVHTFTVIRQNWAEPFRGELPYVVAMVELEEGVKMMSNISDCAADDVHIGMPVEAYGERVEDGLGVLFWRPGKAHRG
ncbi:MAG: Zn-ribbon domain-containing OB-fold protein [Actinobacteria bacterium]|nr:Zn-ribbon domain-containing OB-fold protein [Actinomycetota bacterium]